ncbi:MAG: class I SAM-dependent methyltransferase [Leptolyngbyaceae cyanobacterium RU_5_1]|nr:class I SAM-dependent methyltransferase [Leptolyngbyaceae cyanobacterium RU_5_1]
MKVCLACEQRFDSTGWRCPQCGQMPQLYEGHWSFAPDLAKTNDGFSTEYFAQLTQLEAANFWFRSRNRLVIWVLQSYFPDSRSLLEIGCGTGYVLSGIQQRFPEKTLYGSEIFNEGLAFAAQRLPGVTLLQMDARQIPFEQEFDVVGAFDVLEHIEEDETVLSQMFQATKSGGGILLTVPQHRFLWSLVDEQAFHKRRYTQQELVKKVERAGFIILRVTSFVSLLLPVMMLSRMKRQIMRTDFNPVEEYEIGKVLNEILEKILTVEQGAIASGISFPAGGSLLVIAKRNGSGA